MEVQLFGSEAGYGDRFGVAVGLSGDIALVAANFKDEGAGAGYVFDLDRTPDERIGDLEDDVEDLLDTGTLGGGEANALASKLTGALAAIADGNSEAAANKLRAFIHQVEALVGSGRLTPAEGQDLIDAAQAAIDRIAAP